MPMQSEVIKAAKMLDRDYPGWHKKVKRNILDMGDADHCIIGQLGKMSEAPETYDIRAFGMDADSLYLDASTNQKKLTDLWKQEIKNRRD